MVTSLTTDSKLKSTLTYLSVSSDITKLPKVSDFQSHEFWTIFTEKLEIYYQLILFYRFDTITNRKFSNNFL